MVPAPLPHVNVKCPVCGAEIKFWRRENDILFSCPNHALSLEIGRKVIQLLEDQLNSDPTLINTFRENLPSITEPYFAVCGLCGKTVDNHPHNCEVKVCPECHERYHSGEVHQCRNKLNNKQSISSRTAHEKCPLCAGIGYTCAPCLSCGGRGKGPCLMCGGRGTLSVLPPGGNPYTNPYYRGGIPLIVRAMHPPCSVCNGTGLSATCLSCNGTGIIRTTCIHCKGTGTIEVSRA